MEEEVIIYVKQLIKLPGYTSIYNNTKSLLKTQMFYRHDFSSAEHLMNEIEKYIDYYNNRRIKCKLKGLSPVQYRIQSNKVA